MNVVSLRISSYAGLSYGAQHFYGKLFGYSPEDEYQIFDLTHSLEKEQVEKDNKARRQMFSPAYAKSTCVRVGQESKSFSSEEAVRDSAKAQWKKYFPQGSILIEDGNDSEVGRALAGPEELVQQINSLYAEAESFNFWDGNSRKMRQVSLRYKSLLKEES